jgi:RNA recognition motif-containing protein
LSSETQKLLNFAFVGFYNEEHVNIAVKIFSSKNIVDGKKVTVAAVQTWMLDLYPNRAPG